MSDNIDNRESIIARLISNTKRKKRHDNLVEIARQLRWLEKDLGGMNFVSKMIGISLDQIHSFLSVEKLDPEVRKLVETRQIDLINITHYMRNFDAEAQRKIAYEVTNGRLNASDIRVLAPLRINLKSTSIDQLIMRVQNARNKKVFVIYFRTPESLDNKDKLREKFENIIGISHLVSFEIKDSIGIMEISQNGKTKLMAQAKKTKLSLRDYVNRVIKE
jgi:hypothetical protein